MQHSGFTFYFDIALSYLTFGLAIYAIGGFVALLWIRRKGGTPKQLLRDLCVAYTAIIGLILLEACRQLWDNFRLDRFPVQITRVLVPALYLLIGNTLVSIASFSSAQASLAETKQDSEKRQQLEV